MKILITYPLHENEQDQFNKLNQDFSYIEHPTLEELQEAEIIFGPISYQKLVQATNLKWYQLPYAGVGEFSQLPDHVQLTNSSGVFGDTIAEHALAYTLALEKRVFEYKHIQQEREWLPLDPLPMFDELKILCVGFGDIGQHYAKKAKALGATIDAVKRSLDNKPDYINKFFTLDQLEDQIHQYDVIFVSLPSTPTTKCLFNQSLLNKINKKAILLNVGRGDLVVMQDLVNLMKNAPIQAVYLDVMDPEPLPKNHPLWNTKNVYLTPHICWNGSSSKIHEKTVHQFYENLNRYLKNEPLQQLVDKKLGY